MSSSYRPAYIFADPTGHFQDDLSSQKNSMFLSYAADNELYFKQDNNTTLRVLTNADAHIIADGFIASTGAYFDTSNIDESISAKISTGIYRIRLIDRFGIDITRSIHVSIAHGGTPAAGLITARAANYPAGRDYIEIRTYDSIGALTDFNFYISVYGKNL